MTELVPELDARLRAEGLEPGSWANGPDDRYEPHAHGYDKVIACAAGSIRFELPDLGRSASLEVGDRLELPAGTRHAATVGERGVSCLEAHLPAGRLPGLELRRAGDW